MTVPAQTTLSRMTVYLADFLEMTMAGSEGAVLSNRPPERVLAPLSPHLPIEEGDRGGLGSRDRVCSPPGARQVAESFSHLLEPPRAHSRYCSCEYFVFTVISNVCRQYTDPLAASCQLISGQWYIAAMMASFHQ